jgi:HEAT repeat protein
MKIDYLIHEVFNHNFEVLMKKVLVVLVALVISALVVPALAGESVLPANANKSLIEDNLLIGMQTDNAGLQRSCALMLGQIQSDRAVIALMDVIHNAADENLRVAAAWSLCKIGDARGVYAVKMATRYDESSKVQAVCAWYYENLVKQGSFTFIQPEYNLVAVADE